MRVFNTKDGVTTKIEKKPPVYSGWNSGAHRLPQVKNEDGSYSINYMQVRYNYPKPLAEDLERWHVLDPESSKWSYPLVDKWYSQLPNEQKQLVKRIDINTNSEI